LATDRHLPDGAVVKTILFTILCVLGFWGSARLRAGVRSRRCTGKWTNVAP
jgi:hypothetical protein